LKPKQRCPPVAAIILAAGSASRMGEAKQLLPFRGGTLLQNAIRQAQDAGFGPIMVVVGAYSAEVRASIAALDIEIVENEFWKTGMGSSLAAGVKALLEAGSEASAVAVLLADQPLVTATHLNTMRELLVSSRAGAVAARYDGTLGVPAIFKRSSFSLLASLPPESGARQLLRSSGMEVAGFDLPEAATDIDTPEDFSALRV
jgi:molybdenum cofactor cytidylyltransferase